MLWVCVCVSNVSGWQEVVCHWSSLPISPWGLSSPPPHQPLHQTQGRARTHTHTHTHTHINVYHPTTSTLDHFPFLASRWTPPDPRPPCTPCPILPLLCLTSAPLLPHSPSPVLPRIQPGSVWWMGQHYSCPLLAWFNCSSPSPPHLSVSLSYLFVCLTLPVWVGRKTYAGARLKL